MTGVCQDNLQVVELVRSHGAEMCVLGQGGNEGYRWL